MGISIVRELDRSAIVPVVRELFPMVAEAGVQEESIEGYVNTTADCWLRLAADGDLIGFAKLTPYNGSMLEIHPFIRSNKRRYSYEGLGAVLDYFDTEIFNYSSLITNIPSCKRYATLFAMRMGFSEVGRYSKGFNNEYDMVMFQRMRKARDG